MKNLKALRKAKGLTQAELAKILHTSRSAVAMWETGADASPQMLEAAADFFGVSTDHILGRDGAPNETQTSGLKDVYFRLAKNAQDREIDPRDITEALEMFDRLRKKKD